MNKNCKRILGKKTNTFKKIYTLLGESIRKSIFRYDNVEAKLIVSDYLKSELSGDLDFSNKNNFR